ncbi:MAG: sulfate ABC transporter substrate-binding protein [Nitrososphaera sp.]|nr:sulfate ABC transporter substrate-binding protein [Nitrososphaera sp.]
MNIGVKLGIAAAIVVFVIGSSVALNDRPLFSSSDSSKASDVLRIGYFPNFNHAQAVIGFGNGDYQTSLGNIRVERQVFNAGPAAVEALVAGQIDVAYVGPNPAINGYLATEGKVKVISGVSSGGAVFVVRNDAGIDSADDFKDKKLSSPQLGNTQDVALRTYLHDNGYNVDVLGGNPTILPAKTSDILTLMIKKEMDGAWVPEPWGSRLVRETDSRIFLDERELWQDGKFSTSLIICRTDYLRDNPDTIKKLLAAHVEKTIWVNANKEDAIKEFNMEIEKIIKSELPAEDLRNAFGRMEFTYDPLKQTVNKAAENAFDLGLLGDEKPNLEGMYDLRLLNEVLSEKGLAPV